MAAFVLSLIVLGACRPVAPGNVAPLAASLPAESPPTVSRSDGRVAVRAVREGGSAGLGELVAALGLPDGGEALVEGCAGTWDTNTTLVWVRVGPTLAVEVDADDPRLRTCVERAFADKPAPPALAGVTAAFVLRLGEWASYQPFPRPGPFTREHVDVGVVGGMIGPRGEGAALSAIDLRLSVLAQELVPCTTDAGEALVRARVRGNTLSALATAGSSPALAECARRVFTDERTLPEVDAADFVVAIVWQ